MVVQSKQLNDDTHISLLENNGEYSIIFVDSNKGESFKTGIENINQVIQTLEKYKKIVIYNLLT